MAKVVAPGAFNSSLQMSGGSNVVTKAKRKTPSELRDEQLKRTCLVNQAKESFDALRPCKSTERENGIKKQEQLRNPKYIEMRMDELYPIKKSRPLMFSGKQNIKENGEKEQSSSLINVSLLSNVVANKRQQLIREGEENNASTEVSDDTNAKARQTIEKCSQTMFRSVTELSTRGEELSCLPDIDMNKALKGLASCKPLPVHPGDITGKSNTASLRGNFMSEFHVPWQKIPLDLSLKTYARFVFSSPLSWSTMGSTYNGMSQLKSLSCNVVNQDNSGGSGSAVVSQVLNSMSLHSWVYPQSTLPPFIISALVASPDRGEADFLKKRQLAWEDAFRSLYFMFRKNLCKIFYVCTSQFVAMFTGSCELGDVKRSCNAYITQSTRRLRANLKDLDISFSMPLCKTKMDQTTVEDLAELLEIENHNLGQTRPPRFVPSIDNTPESFLAFEGNDSVHGLYDLLLNYRSSLGFLLTADVPVLYSPIPFQNAALSSPEIKCMEMARTEHKSCLVEIKGEYLPPWIISNICANAGANGQNFEASFVTEPTSVSLNMGLPQLPEKTKSESRDIEGTEETSEPEFGVIEEGTGETNDDVSYIPGTMICPHLRSGYLKSLKYCNKSYAVSLSPS